MEPRTIQVGDIVQVTVQGQSYNFTIDMIDSQGIHASSYLIISQGNTWQVQNYPFPHTIAFFPGVVPTPVPSIIEGPLTLDTNCKLFAGTYEYGRVTPENRIHYVGIKTLKDLHLEAIN